MISEQAHGADIHALILAAGLGTRLRPLTNHWPKCLMPIGDRPLLEYWLQTLYLSGIKHVLVNLHYCSELVSEFLARPVFSAWVDSIYEPELHGTAGSLKKNLSVFKDKTVLLIHADNWCQCDFSAFIEYHQSQRPKYCPITMMTFDTDSPESCGIVEVDEQGVVRSFHEKVTNPPGNKANGAVYLIEPEVLEWLVEQESVNDFSTEVLPNYIGRIATWHNHEILRDIGSAFSLSKAQADPKPERLWLKRDAWEKQFEAHPIHTMVAEINKQHEVVVI